MLIVPTTLSGAKVPVVTRVLSRSKPNEIALPVASEEVTAIFTTLSAISAFPFLKVASLATFLFTVSKVSPLG